MSTLPELNFDTNLVTITRYLQEKGRHVKSTGEFTQLLTAIVTSVKAIGASVRRSGLANLMGMAGETNASGDQQKKLDVVSNLFMTNILKASFSCCALVSEEEETAIIIDTDKAGKYIVCFDPLDGSSNIDCLVSIGTVFSIYKYDNDPSLNPITLETILKPGNEMVAAGYALYGAANVIVLSTGEAPDIFMLDPSIGEFILTDSNVKIKEKGKYYSINEGYTKYWDGPTKEFVDCCKFPAEPHEKPMNARYIGSMVADVHRTLVYGGIFAYPANKNSTKGKLRLLYEAAPMSFIIEKAGGLATTGTERVLDVVPTSLHMRVPIWLGSKIDVENFLEIIEKYGDDHVQGNQV